MKSIELQKGIVIALMLSSVSVQSLNYAALARGGGSRGGGGGWAMSRAVFMRPSFNHFDSGRSDFGRMKSAGAPRAFNRNEFGGVRSAVGAKDFGQHQISAAADRSAHVQDYNWGKSSESVQKNFGQSNLLAKAPVVKCAPAAPASSKSPFGKDHPRRNEVWDRDKILGNKIQDDKGDLSGHYAQLKREDSLIKKQEQIDARLHDGHITPAEQRRLNREEGKMARQIKQDDRGKFPHSLPNQPGPKANVPRTNTPGFEKTGMSPAAAPATGSVALSKNGATTVSSLPSAANLTQLSNVPVSSAGTSDTVATGSTSNAAPSVQSAGGLASPLPMMSPQMFGGGDDSQSDDPYNEGDNTDDSNNSTNPANSATR